MATRAKKVMTNCLSNEQRLNRFMFGCRLREDLTKNNVTILPSASLPQCALCCKTTVSYGQGDNVTVTVMFSGKSYLPPYKVINTV